MEIHMTQLRKGTATRTGLIQGEPRRKDPPAGAGSTPDVDSLLQNLPEAARESKR
jgi:hypothetical protein